MKHTRTTAALITALALTSLSGCSTATEPFVNPSPGSNSDASTEEGTTTDAGDQSWADDKYGTFDAFDASGDGDDIVDLPEAATVGIITAEYDGSDNTNFIVAGLSDDGTQSSDLPINTMGAYEGTVLYGLYSDISASTSLQVTADGHWSLHIAPVSSADTDFQAHGDGDAVFTYDGDPTKLHATHDGERNFIVYQAGGDLPKLLVNELGTYDGTVALGAGPSIISVQAQDDWTLELQ